MSSGGTGQSDFSLKPGAAFAARTARDDIGRCRLHSAVEMAIYSLTGNAAFHFTLNQNKGTVGLWTKADSVTYFDDFEIVHRDEPGHDELGQCRLPHHSPEMKTRRGA